MSTETLNTALQDLRVKLTVVEGAAELAALQSRAEIQKLALSLDAAWKERDEAKAALEQDRKSYDAFAARLTEANQLLQAQVARLMKAPAARRVMIDLETFGTRPGALIVSLGAVRFGEGKILDRYYARIDPLDAQARGLVIDAATVVWWMQQSAESRIEIAAGGGKPLADVLGEFTAWLGEEPTEIWGNGASFDNVLLDEAFRACGLKRPWAFWMDRCYRTMKERHPEVKLVRKGTHHNALDDAESQALHLMAMGVGA